MMEIQYRPGIALGRGSAYATSLAAAAWSDPGRVPADVVCFPDVGDLVVATVDLFAHSLTAAIEFARRALFDLITEVEVGASRSVELSAGWA